MKISEATIESIKNLVAEYEVSEETTSAEFEIEQGKDIIYLQVNISADHRHEREYHDEVSAYEYFDYFEYKGAEITEITAYNENGDEVAVENAADIQF